MSNIISILTEEEIKQVTGGVNNKTNHTNIKEEHFQLMEHPWFLAGVIGVPILLLALNIYCCCGIVSEVTSRSRSGLDGRNFRDFLSRKLQRYRGF